MLKGKSCIPTHTPRKENVPINVLIVNAGQKSRSTISGMLLYFIIRKAEIIRMTDLAKLNSKMSTPPLSKVRTFLPKADMNK